MTDRLKQTETIARACGWETLTDSTYGVQVFRTEDGEGWKAFEEFNPFTSEADWFRAFDAMECKFLTVNKMIFVAGPDMWTVKVDGDYYAEHPDRLTAMALALHAAARAKLGEVEG